MCVCACVSVPKTRPHAVLTYMHTSDFNELSTRMHTPHYNTMYAHV